MGDTLEAIRIHMCILHHFSAFFTIAEQGILADFWQLLMHFSYSLIFTKLGSMTDADKARNPQHFGSHPVDIRSTAAAAGRKYWLTHSSTKGAQPWTDRCDSSNVAQRLQIPYVSIVPRCHQTSCNNFLITFTFKIWNKYITTDIDVQTLAAKALTHDPIQHWAAVVTECKSLVVVFLETVWNVNIKPLTRKRLYHKQDNDSFYHATLWIARTMLSQYVHLSIRHTPVFCRNS